MDIQWWLLFLVSWNGTATMQGDPTTNPQVVVTSDASRGAFVGQQWFMLPWAGPIQKSHITVKELAPIIVAALV